MLYLYIHLIFISISTGYLGYLQDIYRISTGYLGYLGYSYDILYL